MKLATRFFLPLLAALIFPPSKLAAQGDSLKPLKNIIEVFNSRNNSLEGIYPNLQPNYSSQMLMGGWGIGYIRFVGKRHIGLEGSFHGWYWGGGEDTDPSTYDPVGFIMLSSSYYYGVRMHYPLVSKPTAGWYASGGCTFRTGADLMVIQQGSDPPPFYQEMFTENLPHRDLGLSCGTRFSWFPHRRIVLSGDVRYTRFVYRHTTGSEYVPSYEGTTRNVLSIQAKLGFCF